MASTLVGVVYNKADRSKYHIITDAPDTRLMWCIFCVDGEDLYLLPRSVYDEQSDFDAYIQPILAALP